MFHNPIQQGPFKADIFPGFFALDPLMLQNFRSLGKKLLVKRRFSNELRLICFRRRHVCFFFHKFSSESTPNGSLITTNQTPIRRVNREIYSVALRPSDMSLWQRLTNLLGNPLKFGSNR